MKIYKIKTIFLLFLFAITTSSNASRAAFSFIDTFLMQYKREFTVLLLGDDMASMSLKLAAKFPQGIIVAIAEDKEKKLLSRIEENKPNNIIFFRKRPSREELQMLADCEHFDVTCCGAFLSRKTQQVLDIMKNSGDFLIICPTEQMREGNLPQILAANAIKLDKNGLVYLKKIKKNFMKRKWWGAKKTYTARKYSIISNFKEKYLVKPSADSKTSWVNGINLTTFYLFNAIYPARFDVVPWLQELEKISHYDKSMTNIIIKGRKVELIDFSDRKHTLFKNKLKSVIAAFKGEVYAYNNAGGNIRYQDAI